MRLAVVMNVRTVKRGMLALGLAGSLAAHSALAAPTTLQDALVEAYNTNPTLQAERANLRATDEGVPQALAGWRPTVTITGQGGWERGREKQDGYYSSMDSSPLTENLQVTESLFAGGGTRAAVHKAKNTVYAERANLIATEESVFAQVISDYVTVIEDQQLLSVNTNNVQVLEQQLKATNDRYRVGELTQTDVAQAQAAVDGAKSQQATAAGNLASAQAAYAHDIGSAPVDLVAPSALRLNVNDADTVGTFAAKNNANVVAAQFNLAAAQDNVDTQFAALLPQINAELVGTRAVNQSAAPDNLSEKYGEALLAVTVPLYQGGAEYSKVRQAKEQVEQAEQKLIDARLASQSSAVQAYETLLANQAAADSDRSEISADQIALSGVEREALVGTATTLDVLIQEQDLLQARTSLVQNLAQVVASSYGVAAAMGQLTARDLALDVPLYDETAYYDSVDTKLWGVSTPDPVIGK